VVWYLTYLADTSVRIGITAYTRAAVHNLLQRIVQVQQQRGGANFKLISMVRKVPKEPVEGMISCQASSLNRHLGKGAVVIGGTVWDWSKVRQTWPSEAGCDIFIIDEASQVSGQVLGFSKENGLCNLI
jgi:DNA replication ATP-dependent helicase Dna2